MIWKSTIYFHDYVWELILFLGKKELSLKPDTSPPVDLIKPVDVYQLLLIIIR